MSGGWLETPGSGSFRPRIYLGSNIVHLELSDAPDYRNGLGDHFKYHWTITATDTGGHEHVLWKSPDREWLREHSSDESRAEAEGMLRQIADHFANNRTGPAT